MWLTRFPIKIVLVYSSLEMPAKKSQLQSVQVKKKTDRHTIKITKTKTNVLKNEIAQYLDANGFLSWSSKDKKYVILGTNTPKKGLVECPECKIGQLMVIRSRTTRKRFMGCSNYYGGCKASSPLLQKAKLRAIKKACSVCKWPMVIFRYSKKQKWTRQCSNFNCESRKPKPSK